MDRRARTELRAAGFPRFFVISGFRINAYRVFLWVGLYVGIITTALMAKGAGESAWRMGLATLSIVVVGLIGARVYYLATSCAPRTRKAFWVEALRTSTGEGGASVLGALVVLPFSILPARWAGVPVAAFWDYLIIGVCFGAAFVRFGCICNGCCGGRESHGWFAVTQHDVHGVSKPRKPVQWIEIASWLIGGVVLLSHWHRHSKPGSYALSGLAWYGCIRFCLEPWREEPDPRARRAKINRIVAGLLALGAGGGLLILAWRD